MDFAKLDLWHWAGLVALAGLVLVAVGRVGYIAIGPLTPGKSRREHFGDAAWFALIVAPTFLNLAMYADRHPRDWMLVPLRWAAVWFAIWLVFFVLKLHRPFVWAWQASGRALAPAIEAAPKPTAFQFAMGLVLAACLVLVAILTVSLFHT